MRAAGGKTWDGRFYLTVLLLCFFVGAFGGFLLATIGTFGGELRGYLSDYFALAAGGRLSISFFSVLWDVFRWPLAAAAFSLTPLGVGAIPALLMIRGFLLSYAAACFGALMGVEGAAVAAAVFGVTALFTVPALLVIACESFRSAFLRVSGACPLPECKPRPAVLLPGAGVLVIAAALQWTVSPALMSAVCARFFS